MEIPIYLVIEKESRFNKKAFRKYENIPENLREKVAVLNAEPLKSLKNVEASVLCFRDKDPGILVDPKQMSFFYCLGKSFYKIICPYKIEN